MHLNASLNVGLTTTEIIEAITHSAGYCGFPKALNAVFVAKRVFAQRELLPVETPTDTCLGIPASDASVPGTTGDLNITRSQLSFAGDGTVSNWPGDTASGVFGPRLTMG